MAIEAENAVLTLGCEDKPLRARVQKAWLSHLSKLDPSQLPPPYAKRLNAVRSTFKSTVLAIDAIEALEPPVLELVASRMIHFAFDLRAKVGH